jgi:protein involved in polysaccharide export with SLBB domain
MRYPLILLALALFAAPALAQQAGAPPAATSSYTIRAGDVLKVTVWGHEEYSGEFVVDEATRLQFPILGDLEAKNLTVAQLREKLRTGLEQIFKQPFVTIEPLFRMAVLGQVQNPGLYTVNPGLSVLDVVAMAGGPTQSGSLNKIGLLRSGEAMRLSLNKGSLQDIGIHSGDQIMVGRKAFSRDDVTLVLGVVQVALSVAILVTTLNN